MFIRGKLFMKANYKQKQKDLYTVNDFMYLMKMLRTPPEKMEELLALMGDENVSKEDAVKQIEEYISERLREMKEVKENTEVPLDKERP